MARNVLQHPGETSLFGCQADPKTLHVYTDTDWAADELTRKSVSCTVERYGSHMIDCSVAQSLVALSSREAEFYGIVRAVATSKQTSQILEQIGMQSEVTIASVQHTRNMLQDVFQSKSCGYKNRIARKSSRWCRPTRC